MSDLRELYQQIILDHNRAPRNFKEIFGEFHRMITGSEIGVDRRVLGKLAAFSGVREFPARVKCASLSWHTLKAALNGAGSVVSTE
jgi:nitrogen fixation NifU-like protein